MFNILCSRIRHPSAGDCSLGFNGDVSANRHGNFGLRVVSALLLTMQFSTSFAAVVESSGMVGQQLAAAGLAAIPLAGGGVVIRPLPILDADRQPNPVLNVVPELFLGGKFQGFGQSRLGFLDAKGALQGPAIGITGVQAALVRPEAIYLGGAFTAVAGERRMGLARLGRNGVLDAAWTPEVQGVVQVMLLTGDRLYVGGAFTSVNGLPRKNLAVLDATSGKVLEWNPAVAGPVYALAAGDANDLYVGGDFMVVGDTSCERLAKVSRGDGLCDPAFAIPCDGPVRALVVRDQSLFVGGLFQRIGSVQRGGMAKVNLATNALANEWRANTDGPVQAMSASGATLYVGGTFTTVGGAPRNNLARVELASGIADAWVADTNEGVTALAEDVAGDLLVSGRFTAVAGQVRGGFAKITAAGVVEESWRPVAGAGVAAPCIATDGSVIVTGGDGVLDGPQRHHVVGLDAQGKILDWRIEVTGNPVQITAIAVTPDLVYLGGDFTAINGVSRAGLARVERRTGAVDLNWRADADSVVRSLLLQGQNLYVGGNFSRLSTVSQPYAGRVDLVRGALEPWRPTIDAPVFALASAAAAGTASSELWLAGAFTQVNGERHLGMVKLRTEDGAPLGGTPDLRDAQGQPGVGNACVVLADGRVAVGGSFATVAGIPRGNLALLDSQGQPIPTWRLDVDGSVQALVSDGQRLAIGGGFSQAGGQDRKGLVVSSLGAEASIDQQFLPMDGAVQALALRGSTLWLGGQFPGGAAAFAWPGGTPLALTPADGPVQAVGALIVPAKP